jgi:hypothetical protein
LQEKGVKMRKEYYESNDLELGGVISPRVEAVKKISQNISGDIFLDIGCATKNY